ncbi:hypothetical protein AB0H69_09565 [Streptomyces phaeochromogenes]|uniref:hypothetical protein n=1 Tax=Streptomyces phaeochromogenes TaxID=1923 RepID=UPI0033D886CC
MKDPNELSFPAQAVYSELERTGEIMRRDEFSQEFSEDYEAIIKELEMAGLHSEPIQISRKNSTGVVFKNRNTRYSLEVH